MKPRIEVAAAIIWRQGRILISQRDANSHLSGYWEFPGGKREAGESFEECLVREVREELNIRVRVQKLLDTIAYEYPEKHVTLKFFCCDYLEGEPRALGCLQFQWVSPEQLSGYQFPPADGPIVKRIMNAEL
jgi:8-oxo-dGTP diphosphatase